MLNAILSKVRLDLFEDFHSIEFNACVHDLLALDVVKRLSGFSQHLNTSRMQHSINVSYYSYLVCKRFHWNHRAAARAGLLHDLFLYDWRKTNQKASGHAATHPKVALENARENVYLDPIEEDAIVKHMWPLTPAPPRYKESYVVSCIDKYCACCEVLNSLFRRSGRCAANVRLAFAGGCLTK